MKKITKKAIKKLAKKYGMDAIDIQDQVTDMESDGILVICNYDRGWNIEPTCEAAELALAILLKSHN